MSNEPTAEIHKRPRFDPQITFGNLCTIFTTLVFCLGIVWSAAKQSALIDTLKEQVSKSSSAIDVLNTRMNEMHLAQVVDRQDVTYIKSKVTDIREEQKLFYTKFKIGATRLSSGPIVISDPDTIIRAPWPDFKITPN